MASRSEMRSSGHGAISTMTSLWRCFTIFLLSVLVVGTTGHKKRQAPPIRGLEGQDLLQVAQDPNAQPTVVEAAPATAAVASAASPLAAVHAQSKFFQYMHVPKKDHYELGHRQGSEDHFTERHEKANLEDGVFKAKVRWGDKNGGYGEHYWDFNHAGHGGDSQDEPSDNVHEYDEYDGDNNRNKRDSKHHSEQNAPSDVEIEHYLPEKQEHIQYGTKQEEISHYEPQIAETKEWLPQGYSNIGSKQLRQDIKHYSPNKQETAKHVQRKRQNKRQHNVHQTTEKYADPIYVEDAAISPTEHEYVVSDIQTQQPEIIYGKNKIINPTTKLNNHRLKKETLKPQLYLDETTGRIVDKNTGQTYILQPI